MIIDTILLALRDLQNKWLINVLLDILGVHANWKYSFRKDLFGSFRLTFKNTQ